MSDNGKNGRAVYVVIRTENLAYALARFRDKLSADPVAVVVNAAVMEKADTAETLILALDVAGLDIPVTTSGGCLLGEVWLQRPAVDVKAAAEALRPHSLTARVSAARRTGTRMTAERARQLALEMEVER